jgi:rare lipoprotein A
LLISNIAGAPYQAHCPTRQVLRCIGLVVPTLLAVQACIAAPDTILDRTPDTETTQMAADPEAAEAAIPEFVPSPPAPTLPPADQPVLDAAEIGVASWYGPGHQGRRMANGARFDMYQLIAAHPTLPLGSRVRVINLANSRTVLVTILDRGPTIPGRIVDLSRAAAEALGARQTGIFRVALTPVSGSGTALVGRPREDRPGPS